MSLYSLTTVNAEHGSRRSIKRLSGTTDAVKLQLPEEL